MNSSKSGMTALLLVLFLGPLGAHRFYVGKTGSGIAQLLTLGGMGLWAFYDLVLIAMGKFTDSDGRTLVMGQAAANSSSAASTHEQKRRRAA